MLCFRPSWPALDLPAGPLTPDAVRQLVPVVFQARHFFLAGGRRIQVEHTPERRRRWEIFRGRLLDPSHTREETTFEEWNLHLLEGESRPPEPVLSLLADWPARQLHVVRALECHFWEGYDSGGGVFLSRETTRWVRELTGTILLDEMTSPVEFLDELVSQVFHAVVGASRLPLTSVEAPLPDFSLGRLAYFFTNSPTTSPPLTPGADFNPLERAKLLETLLLATPVEDMGWLAATLRGTDVPSLLRAVFNEVSLSPWTDLVAKTLA